MRALPNYRAGDVVSIGPSGLELSRAQTETLIRDGEFEIARIVLQSGEEHAGHTSAGPVVLQCIVGRVQVSIGEITRQIQSGELMYLSAGTRHSLTGICDSAVLFVGMHSPRTLADRPAAQTDAVDEASMESFPASDPPAISTPG